MPQPCATCYRDAEAILITEPVDHPALLGDARIQPICLSCADEALDRAPLDLHHEITLIFDPDRR